MRPRSRSGLAAALAAVALGAGGCPERSRPADASVEVADAGPTSPRAQVKVPLPPGWAAQVARDGSFQAGPPGRPVLRVDLRPGEGGALPSPDALAAALPGPLTGMRLAFESVTGDAERTLVRVRVVPPLTDAGGGDEFIAFFGARRVGEDLFLCASLPGATAQDVELAAAACGDITLPER